MMSFMRTTLDINDHALTVARSFAAAEHCTLGQAVSQLILEPRPQFVVPEGFPVFDPGPGHVITNEMIAEALDEDY